MYKLFLQRQREADAVNLSTVDLFPHVVNLYVQTKMFHNKWLIYILGGSIYPVHG